MRGFSGNKSNVIGSAVSRAFRVISVAQNLIQIRNPFSYYSRANMIVDLPYRTAFDANQLLMYEQDMNLRADLVFKFTYAYASTCAWNGGTFVGKPAVASNFYGVWNAGSFSPLNPQSNFTGEWFSTPAGYYWAGSIFVNVVQSGNSFVLQLDFSTVGLNWPDGDLVRVDFNTGSPAGFYDKISSGSVSNSYNIFFNSGYYDVNVVRLKTTQLINDRNLAIGPETDVAYHGIFDKNIYDWTKGNAALLFNGSTTFNVSYVIRAIENSSNSFAFDFWFNASNVALSEPLLSFRMTSADFTIFATFDGINYYLNVQYSLSSTSYVSVVKPTDSNWHHIYVDDFNGNLFVTYDASDLITFNTAGAVTSQTGAWTINRVSYTGALLLNRNAMREVLIGKYRHTDTLYYVAQDGAIDQLRFWNQLLLETQVQQVYNAKILSKRFPQIAAQITFDDPSAEFMNTASDKLSISNVEYVSNISVCPAGSTEFMLYLNFEIEQLESYTPIVKFSTAQVQNLLLEKTYQILAINNGTSIDIFLQHTLYSDALSFFYTGVAGSLPNFTDLSNQFFYSTNSLNNFIFSYDATINNGLGTVTEHAFVLSNSNSASWNSVPRIYVTFVNNGASSTITVLSGTNAAAPTTVFSTPKPFNFPLSPTTNTYSVATVTDSLNNITVTVTIGQKYSAPAFNFTFASPIPLNTTVYVGNAYGSDNAVFQNRGAETFERLGNTSYGAINSAYITNKKWIFNRTQPFSDATDLQTAEVYNLNLPQLFHFGDETVSNIGSESLIKYNEINVYANDGVLADELSILNNFINGDDVSLNVLLYVNGLNYQNYSNYFIIYPRVGDYGVLIENGTSGTAGFVISGVGTPETVTNFGYFTGYSLSELRLSDMYGTDLDLYPMGGPIVDPSFYTSETFALDNSGNPRWTQDNVAFTSSFNNGNYISKTWRAGYFNNGLINVANFVWKWGVMTGGSIVDLGY